MGEHDADYQSMIAALVLHAVNPPLEAGSLI